MSLKFQDNGNLEPGIHALTLEEFEAQFGGSDHRKKLITGLKLGLKELQDCGCKRLFIDGSFVTTKEVPGDFDACWDPTGVNLGKLVANYSTLLDFANGRKNQKARYYGEFFISEAVASKNPFSIFLDFFQTDRDKNPKGIIQINLI